MVKQGSQCAKLLRALSDNNWHSLADLHRRAGPMIVHSRISDLRKKHGYEIEHRHVEAKRAALSSQYRLVGEATGLPPDPTTHDGQPRLVLDRDSVPRDAEHRYRIYRVIAGESELVAAVANATEIGNKLLILGKEGQFKESCVGILDTYGTDSISGSWVINPFDSVVLK